MAKIFVAYGAVERLLILFASAKKTYHIIQVPVKPNITNLYFSPYPDLRFPFLISFSAKSSVQLCADSYFLRNHNYIYQFSIEEVGLKINCQW